MIDQILKHGDDRIITHSVKQEILSIRVQAVVLQLNLKHYPDKETIKEAAVSTHEIIGYLLCDENLSDGKTIDPTVRLANRLRELVERLESTVGDVVDFVKGGKDSVSSITDSPPDVCSSSRSAIASSKDDDEVVGFRQDLAAISIQLCNKSSRLMVFPIVGTGGIGKTTLAKLVYNDSLIRKNFSTCAWVTISQDHSVERIVLNLLASIKEISNAESDIPMETLICEYLKGRTYLIVMDDMWSKKAWDDVKSLFPDACNGSRIIVTTKVQDVAAYKVFGDKDIPIELEDIGKKIVQNCGGLPLSIVMVAGLLSKIPIQTRSSWKQIAANGGQLETIIGSSYTHLPNHLKLCLLYMAGFPEDQEIRVTELVNLWISEGFVTLSNGSKSLEEGAEDCLEDLVERSLVLVTNRKSDGKIKSDTEESTEEAIHVVIELKKLYDKLLGKWKKQGQELESSKDENTKLKASLAKLEALVTQKEVKLDHITNQLDEAQATIKK
ncbi:putative late blight resistance protein homolog R1A-10 [Salvia miltiorrhiza]|uniref:putative late blight resistance protein homolog R1A-10 n=1 Tax=Salvia miltiorrhiza TaxID=226208 RepID=UPI0025AC8E2D|nr:putative late blight resistance protein homolog R1A-10 [Salvia miltiorrhiza]